MINVVINRNPCDPSARECAIADHGATVRSLTERHSGGADWPVPTVAIVNGEPWMRERWGDALPDGALVEFRSVVLGGGTSELKERAKGQIVGQALAFVLSGGTSLATLAGADISGGYLRGKFKGVRDRSDAIIGKFDRRGWLGSGPDTPSAPSAMAWESGSPTYSLDAQGNRKRVGEPIPVIYGRMRVYPDFIEPPFLRFGYGAAGVNDQFFYGMMCIGHGTYDLVSGTGEPLLDNRALPSTATVMSYTNRGSFPTFGGGDTGLQTPALPMIGATGQLITTTSTDAMATLACRYASGNLSGEVDVVFPSGLFDASSGSLANRSVTITVLLEERNSGGTLINSNSTAFTITAASRGEVRRTLAVAVTWFPVAGNTFKIYAYRSAAESTSLNIVERCQLAGAKLIRSNYSTSGKTLVGLALTASAEIDGDAATKFSTLVNRKLPIWNGSTWSAPTATRSIAWALADILRDTSYGCGIADSGIDLAALLALDAIWSARGDYFDGVFDQTLTAWEALEKVAAAGRAVPVLRGGVVSFVRDQAQTVPVALFTSRNTVPGSLQIDYQFRDENDPDGIDLTYLDPATWQPKHVVLPFPGGSGPTRPLQVDLFGVTDSAQATREATYQVRRMAYRPKQVRFQTELDGFLLSLGSLILFQHDLPGWGQGGEVVGSLLDGAYLYLTLSETPQTAGATTKYITLRKPDGSPSGPHEVYAVAGNEVLIDALPWSPRTDLSAGDRTRYSFGQGSSYQMQLVVSEINPAGDGTVEVVASPYDARVHAAGA